MQYSNAVYYIRQRAITYHSRVQERAMNPSEAESNLHWDAIMMGDCEEDRLKLYTVGLEAFRTMKSSNKSYSGW